MSLLGLSLDLDALWSAICEAARRDPVKRAELIDALGLGAPPLAELVTVADAAAHACVHADTIRRWIRDGRLTEHRAGRLVRVARAEFEALLAAAPPDTVRVPPRAGGGRFGHGARHPQWRARRADAEPTPEELARRDFGRRDRG